MRRRFLLRALTGIWQTCDAALAVPLSAPSQIVAENAATF
jgi:hypothetical protein